MNASKLPYAAAFAEQHVSELPDTLKRSLDEWKWLASNPETSVSYRRLMRQPKGYSWHGESLWRIIIIVVILAALFLLALGAR